MGDDADCTSNKRTPTVNDKTKVLATISDKMPATLGGKYQTKAEDNPVKDHSTIIIVIIRCHIDTDHKSLNPEFKK